MKGNAQDWTFQENFATNFLTHGINLQIKFVLKQQNRSEKCQNCI